MGIFDYWSPATALQRLLCGAAVDQMQIDVNGDYHEFQFNGLAQDVVDSSSLGASGGGVAELLSFPAEPALGAFDYSIVPGNLGQAWLGNFTHAILHHHQRFHRVEERAGHARQGVRIERAPRHCARRALGDRGVRPLQPGRRRHGGPLPGGPAAIAHQRHVPDWASRDQMMGVYLKSVIPVVPEFDDGENRLQWKFRSSRAQGTVDNEIAVAFG